MMKITADTTLGELALEMGKHGVTDLQVGIAPGTGMGRAYRVTMATLGRRAVVGSGRTLPEALDDALARVLHIAAEASRG